MVSRYLHIPQIAASKSVIVKECGSGREFISNATFSRLLRKYLRDAVMMYTVVFETDALPLIVGDYKSLDEAYGVAVELVIDFQKLGLPSLYKFHVVSKD